MKRSQIQRIKDKKTKKRQEWSPNMYCTHPIHTVNNRGYPVRITEKMYNEKQCMIKKCQYFFIDRRKTKHGIE